jgi:methionyl aminopeptidase
MSITTKSAEEQAAMRLAGRAAASVLEYIGPLIKVGMTTGEINDLCHQYITQTLGCIPAPLGYGGGEGRPPFPKSVCTSVNHVVCHGIPGDKPLKKGDALNVDVTVIKDGFHGDTSSMFFIGEPSVQAKRLAAVTREAMIAGIKEVKPGATLGDIGFAVEEIVKKAGFSVVLDYCGHGIGRVFHEDPQILHHGKRGEGMALKPGMCFTIEPMVNVGRHETRLLPDGWTVVTKDHSLSAQWEHTILVTESGYEVLTLRTGETL